MAGPLRIQRVGAIGASPLPVSITGVTPGSTIIVAVTQTISAARTYTVYDNVNGAYTERAWITNSLNSKNAGIWAFENSAGGALNITVDGNIDGTSVNVDVFEVGPCTFDVAGEFTTTTNSLTHYSADVAGISSSGPDCYVIAVGGLGSTGGTLLPGSGYTLGSTSGQMHLSQDRTSDTALSGIRGSWTSTTARQVTGVMAIFRSLVDSSPPSVTSSATDATGNSVSVFFNEPVTGSTGFTIDATNGPITLTLASGSGTTELVFTTSRQILVGESLLLNYTAGNVVDLASNPLANITNFPVENNSTTDLTKPTIVSATFNSTGTELAVAFSEPVNGTLGFTLQSSATAIVPTYSTGAGTASYIFTTNRVPQYNESLLLVYTPGDIADLSSNTLDATEILVINGSTEGSPGGGSGVSSPLESSIIRRVN